MKNNKKKLFISLAVIILLLLIILFHISLHNYKLNPLLQMKSSGNDIIHHIEYEDGTIYKDIFVSEKDGKLYFDVYERPIKEIQNGSLGFLGYEYGYAEKVDLYSDEFSSHYYKPEVSNILCLHKGHSTEIEFFAYYIQKAPENANNTMITFDNYIVTVEIIEHNQNKYQFITVQRIINHGMSNFDLDDMNDIINKINKANK